MPDNHKTITCNEMRRRDRAKEENWIREFLHKAPVGNLATAAAGQPFVNMNTFVYHEEKQAIYFHTARQGRTRDTIVENPHVCFSASEMGRLLPAKEAMHFSVEFNSVVVFGTCAIVDDETEAKSGLQLLLDKYFPHLKPGRDYRAVVPEELKLTAVYRIDIAEWSGKQKAVEEDFPGAFFYKG